MKALKVIPVSDMVHKQQAVLAMADSEPVILAQSKGRAVLVSIEEWNRQQEELEILRAYVRAESEWQQKNSTDEDWVEADDMLDKWAIKHGKTNATSVVE